uniref:Otogelin n=1 Tax=Paramormyrops kingsleyae TaxID=1676925 RepID=A0A3B3RBH6_9TELE
CGHANSCNCSLYQATGIRCQTVPNSGMEREMTCRTWGQYNYETFDGLYYYFPGSCTYTLVRDCEETTQSSIVIQVHNDPDCPRSPYSCARSVSLFLPWEGEIRLKKHDVTFRGQSLQLPHSVHDVELERISQYILVTQPHGFTLAWEGHSSSVYIKMSPEYVGRTCGLCGNFNADVQDDLKTSYGLFTEDLAVFGNSWMDVDPQRAACPLVPSRYPSPCSALDPNTLQKVMEVCASLLEDPFKSCHEFVSPFPYMASCSNDLYLLGKNYDIATLCQVLTEYARACAHAERPLEGWRDHMPQCVVSCPPELIYQECISCCPVSCSVDRLCIDSRLQCLDGCYCGEGEIYKNGSCMKALDCPCEHHGMVYLPGQTIQEECNTCTCLGGLWNCSEHSCPGECSVTGDIHFETFDGRVYTFHATCQYVLAKSRNSGRFTVTIQNTPCGPNLDGACIQSVTVVMDEDPKAEVTMTHGGEVFVAGQYRISLPYLDEVFHIQELSSMFLQVRAAHGLLLQYNWGEFRLYLQVDESWKDDTVGLCGTFNGNSQDDFFSPSGMIESTPPLFGNSWKLSSACVQSPSVPQLDPCDTHQQAASYAAEMCELLNQAPFSACHALLSPLPFQQRCRADTCKCGRPCLCSALAGYARGCRKHGVTVDFRTHVPDCAITCPETMVYGTCVSSCERRCPSAAVAQHCGGECEEGCVCALGTFYSSRTHKTCPPGQLYHDCADLDGRLPASKGVECEQTCETYLLNLTCSTHEPCVAGCVCPLGLLRHGDECFEPEACPCVWKGKEFFPGDKVTSPCHHCVCQHGTFQCEFRPCPSMCTAYGDRHYKTFDGLQFDYAGACKVYLLKSDVDASVSVTTENVDCFDSGVICRKSLVISIGKSVVAFDDDSGKPNPTSLIDSQQGLFIWQAGYFTILHVPNEDLTVMWDTKTTVHIQAGPRWQGKLVGLCGNYDLKTVNEMRTPENIESATPQEFGNSWTTAECVNSPDIRHPCSLSPLREPFAKRQCGILLSEVFQLCHPVVDVTWFYMNCLTDTCGCSRGGDCECFCTSVSAYAHRCCQLGVSVDWRSPAMCPISSTVLGKGPYRLLTYREKDTLLAANSSGGVVFSLKGVSPATGVTTLFMMTPGLSRARPHDPSLVSFEAAERPNFFLRVGGDGLLRLTKWEDSERFWDESTYVLHRDTWISGYDSLESFAVRGHFLHSASPRLRLAKYSHSASFRRSILFRLMGTNSGTSMGPRCQWRYETCFSACFRTCSDPYGQTCTTIPKVEGCLPQCPGHMVLDEVTQRCVHLEDCKFSPDSNIIETTGPEEARVTTVVEVLTPSVIPSPPKVATTLHPEASTSSWTTKLPADEPELHGTSRATTVLSPVPKLTTAATMSTMLSTGKVTTAPVSHWLTSTRAVSDLTSRTTRSASTPPLLVLLSMASTTTSILPIAPASPSEMTTMKSTPTTTVPTTALHISTVTTTSAVSIPPTKVYRETSMPDSTETAKLTTRSTTEATPLPATGTAIKTSLTTAPSRPVHTEAGASSIHTTESTTPVTLQTTHPSTLETRRPLIWEITSEKLVATSPVDLRTSTTPVLPSVSTSTVRTTLFPATASTSESPIPTKKTTVISTSAISSTATGASTLPIPETSTETTTVHPVTSTVSTLKTSPSVSLDIATTVKSTATSPVTTVTSDSGLTTTNVSTLMTQTTTTQAIVLDVSHTSVKSPETPAVTSEAPHVISTASVSTPTTTGVITPGSETSTLPVTLSPTEATTKAVSSMAAKHPSAPTTSTEYVPFKTSLTPVQWTDRVTTSEVPAKPFTSYSTSTTEVPRDVFTTTAAKPIMVTVTEVTIIDECTKYVCVGGQLILFNKSQNCPFKATPPNCGLLGFAILVNGDKCCPLWDCPCRCSVFPDLNVITFDGNSVGVYKAASYVVSQLPNETVSIQVRECRSTDSLLWNFTNLCLVALNITHNSHQVLVNRLQRRVGVSVFPRFKKNGFEVLDTGNMYLIRTPAGLKMQWFHSTGMMVIETDGYNNKLPTMGLCGCCDGSPANDLTLSNGTALGKGEDPAVFIDSWQLPNTTSYISHSRRREVNCSTSDCSRCLDMLRNSTFRPCHAFVPPSVFCEVWVRDEEYVKNPCVSLAAYVASCHKFNICVKWRSPDFCPFACPPGLRYQGCLPACTAQSCPNQEFDSEPEECSGLTEGCVCPEGTVLHRPYSALCIPSEKCACTDSSGNPRALGEVWTTSRDGCCMYKCDNDSIVPVEYDCTDVPQPVCRRMGEVVTLPVPHPCLFSLTVCNQTLCESYPPQCKYGEKLVSYFREDSCCPDYICECDPSRCESDVPTCREDQTLIATRADGSCCLAYICMCGPCADVIPQCQEGEVLTVDTNSTERCCPAYHCVCEPYRCPKVSCLPGMSEVTVASPERCCPLQTCECACDTIPRPKCHLWFVCLWEDEYGADSRNEFVSVCSEREAVCLDGERGVMRPGQTLVEHSPEGVCYTTQCTHALDTATGFFRTRATSRNCSSQCQPNQVYIPPKDQMTCCGFCKNISCMYTNENGSVELYKPGRTWVSDCLKYECTDTLSGPTLVSYPFSCPPFNESECIKVRIGGTILSYMGGCCRTCKEDGKSCQKVTVRMTIRKNDCRSNRPVNIVSCDGKCPSASIYNYNINTYARFCKCCREVGLQKRSVQLFCSGNSTWVTYTIQEPTDCSCQWS